MERLLNVIVQIAVFHNIDLSAMRPSRVDLVHRLRHQPDCLTYAACIFDKTSTNLDPTVVEPFLALSLDTARNDLAVFLLDGKNQLAILDISLIRTARHINLPGCRTIRNM